ncbi:MAG: CHAT domain-containing protein [Anaerolineales bacterium]|nr:CHAT domain-containing protein [Anaerolineales bacterium]
MPHSYAETASLTCPQCQQAFQAEIWLIVDTAARTDLLEKIRAGGLHTLPCPHCSQPVQVDAPLLLYRLGEEPALIFSPAPGADDAASQQQARGLAGMLRINLGEEWQDAWVQGGLPGVRREALSAVLSGESQIDAQRSQLQIPPDLRPILEALAQPARLSDMPRRVNLCLQALGMIERNTQPELWAVLEGELANSLAQNPLGERAENLEQAISHYQQALEVRTRQAYPEQWATTQNNLAAAYRERIRGERAENLEQAIFHCQQALEVYTRQAYPEDWAMTNNNLANAYSERIQGERVENLEQAIFHYQQALEMYTRQAYPERWAGTQNNLANAYNDRIRGERAENLEQAIFHHQQALEVRTRQAYPEDWAMTQNNLAAAYRERIRGERAENLEQAIFHFEQALEVRTRQAYPEDWAMTQNNLAFAYNQRIRGERAENLEQAIFHYQQALEVYTRQAYPEDWAMTQNNLATAYNDRIRGERVENLEQAIQLWEQLWQHIQDSLQSGSIFGKLGQQSRWAGFYVSLVAAYARQALLQPARAAPARRRAVEIAEASKSRLLSGLLGQGRLPAPAEIPAALAAQEQERVALLANIDRLLLAQTTGRSESALEQAHFQALEQRQRLVQELSDLWRGMEAYGPAARAYVALRRGDWLGWDELKALASQSDQRTGWLSIFQGQDEIFLFCWQAGWEAPRLERIPIRRDELRYVYFSNYADEVLGRSDWLRSGRPLSHRWPELGRLLLAPLRDWLAQLDHLVISPQGFFHLLPLHALKLDETTTLLDLVPVSSLPAFSVLSTLAPRPHQKSSQALVLGHTDDDPLTMSGQLQRQVFYQEAREVAAELETTAPYLDEQAHSRELQARAGVALEALHLSCHGLFNADDPLGSVVGLADGPFTARQWMELSMDIDLVTLSACQLGQARSLGGDEMLGFAQALLLAGGHSALLGQWSVNSITTTYLMRDFYRRWTAGQGKAQALRAACLALRDGQLLPEKIEFQYNGQIIPIETKDINTRDPFYWAAFSLYGKWL